MVRHFNKITPGWVLLRELLNGQTLFPLNRFFGIFFISTFPEYFVIIQWVVNHVVSPAGMFRQNVERF